MPLLVRFHPTSARTEAAATKDVKDNVDNGGNDLYKLCEVLSELMDAIERLGTYHHCDGDGEDHVCDSGDDGNDTVTDSWKDESPRGEKLGWIRFIVRLNLILEGPWSKLIRFKFRILLVASFQIGKSGEVKWVMRWASSFSSQWLAYIRFPRRGADMWWLEATCKVTGPWLKWFHVESMTLDLSSMKCDAWPSLNKLTDQSTTQPHTTGWLGQFKNINLLN